MIKALVFISAIFLFIGPTYGLECYHCYVDSALHLLHGTNDYRLNKCNEQNLPASDTLICPIAESQCIYEVLENEYTKAQQIWRTCSNPNFAPCDPKSAPSGLKMLNCSYCGTDRCNLHGTKPEKNTYTIHINANVSLSIE